MPTPVQNEIIPTSYFPSEKRALNSISDRFWRDVEHALAITFYTDGNPWGVLGNSLSKDQLRKLELEIDEVYKESSFEDWDGYGAAPVSQSTTRLAKKILRGLPETNPLPEIAADPDGEISFDWILGPYLVFSLSVGSGGRLSYSALLGKSRVHGTEYLEGKMPNQISDILKRLFSAAEQS